ncbi:MAG: sulfite exporter TauE/SafE family protein [Chloroflexi bacterium]|nr:sulfite exporter TauE/SafE family protein [Chloroflexota bacterium]
MLTAIIFLVETFLVALGAGVFGALLGLGGGAILVPILSLALGIDIHYAIGASIVSVIATSCGAAAAYLRDGVTNIRIAMFLETATTTGAIVGAFIGGLVSGPGLFVVFGIVLFYSAYSMFRRRAAELPTGVEMGPLANFLHLGSSYYDAALNRQVDYNVRGARYGLPLMFIAGAMSGLLGIGSGVLKVPAMDMAMKLPMKVSTATSNLMIGVTAAASAGVYFIRGDVNPLIAAPVALGVLLGARIGARVMLRVRSTQIRWMFILVLAYISLQMLIKGFGIHF